jgi:hypothetical protein
MWPAGAQRVCACTQHGMACGASRCHARICADASKEPRNETDEQADDAGSVPPLPMAGAGAGAGLGALSQGEVKAWVRFDASGTWAKVSVAPAEVVYDVLEVILLALKCVLPAGTTAYELDLYALVDADGKLIKGDPDVANAKEQLLKATKPLAGQLRITVDDVAGGYFVVKRAPLPQRPLPGLTRSCCASSLCLAAAVRVTARHVPGRLPSCYRAAPRTRVHTARCATYTVVAVCRWAGGSQNGSHGR